MNNSYQEQLSQLQISEQLFVRVKKHLIISQTTTLTKTVRINSITALIEVIEYVIHNINSAIPKEEQKIFERFFELLLVKLSLARVQIHYNPIMFTDEIGFITTVLSLKS